jgi:hypothetical protein
MLTFKSPEANFIDNSPIGNWYIKTDRGGDLIPSYIKWDEEYNEFKFNTGTHVEYTFAKIVFVDDFLYDGFFTPVNGEEIIVINKTNHKQYAFYNNTWHEILGSVDPIDYGPGIDNYVIDGGKFES